MSDTTSIETKIDILADFYVEYKGNEKFADFFSYNDLGLPIAYALSNGIVGNTKLAEAFIDETFELLLEANDIGEDDGFDSLDDIILSNN
jgi:hypothetical protein